MTSAEKQPGRAISAHGTPAYKVLVVEDEGLIALDIAGRLEGMGHSMVGTVSTAEEAIAQAGAADIVLMDIRIDGARDGIEAAAEVRERYRLPVVFLTAHADRATLERAKLAGAFGYIVKPLGPASLQAGIEMAIVKHHTERLLDEREAWLRAVVDSVADAAVVTTPEGLVHLMNPAAERLTGWTQAEAEHKPVQAVVRLSHVDNQRAANQRAGDEEFDPTPLAILRDAPVDLGPGCLLTARDGRQLEVEGSVAPVQSSRGHSVQTARETYGAVLTLRDASVRRWEERQLRQAQRVQAAGRLAAGTANEYHNLIGLIRGHAEHLLQQLSGYAAVRPALEEIQQAAIAADRLTRGLAGLGTRQVGNPQAVSLNAVLRRMTRLIEATAGDRIAVSLRPSPHCGLVWADPFQLETAVLKLVIHASNTMASSTMPEGGQLRIETARLEVPGILFGAPFNGGRMVEHVLLGLTYSGVEPDIERLFDPESPSDSGLALALVYSLVAECGGYLSAAPGPHGGSRIEMLLPRVSEQVLLPGPGRAPGRAATVLFVDHRDLIRSELHNVFEAAGYNFLEAGDPAEAVALGEVREGGIDLVVADSSDAAKILDGLRSSYPALKVLRIVDHGESGAGELRRPFTAQMLLAGVAEILDPEPAGALVGQVPDLPSR